MPFDIMACQGVPIEWTDDALQLLRQMRRAGRSCNQIARELSFCSAEAVRRKWNEIKTAEDDECLERLQAQGKATEGPATDFGVPIGVVLFRDDPIAVRRPKFTRLPTREESFVSSKVCLADMDEAPLGNANLIHKRIAPRFRVS